jgi:superfamily II DNA or RNA helicase
MSTVITVGNLYSSIRSVPPLPDHVILQLQTALSYKYREARYMIRAMYGNRAVEHGKEWDGKVNLFWHERGNLFYTGMLSDVRAILEASGIQYDLEFTRKRPPENMPGLTLVRPVGVEDREYQEVSVEMLYEATRGLLQAATGAGKTFMVCDLISRIKTSPFIFYVLSIDLLEQAHGELSKFLNVPIGRVGGGVVDIKDINVVMIQTAIRSLHKDDPKFDIGSYRYDEEDKWLEESEEERAKASQILDLIRNAKGIYFDEVHHAAARTCREVLEESKHAYWRYGGSATPTRDDGHEPMIKALFGRKVVEISASLLIKLGYLVRPHIFMVRMTDNHGDYASYSNIYKHYVVENKTLNNLVVKIIKFFDLHSISNLTLVKHYAQGDYIQEEHGGVPFLKGNQTKKKRVDALDDLRTGETNSCIATTLADEGLDVKRLSAVIVAGGGKSQTRVYQRIGRALRTFKDPVTGVEKDRAVVILFHQNCRFLDNHGRSIRRLLEKEESFIIKDTTPENLLRDVGEVFNPGESLLEFAADDKA